MTAPLPGFETGRRSEEIQYRVTVNPGTKIRYTVSVPMNTLEQAEKIVGQFWVPTLIESRMVVTYTTEWNTVRHSTNRAHPS